ncbi:Haloacid dehalogenase domain protein hydrolase [Caldicellulosiruptor hydrothermalis 108]|uniref:Haloacid dehalogenase domain protein hydrolase n=1 Tax=Caldicellulosiruptor hydrothermalis (strain DSM 18901 / VKM B-2411 / 108) TaxID=632292 RepID=E4Q8G9_CALH1|nr:haloacid dehalogenase [Caldicellulosiruptor hydrothermalis]ADQ06814.1 Haloacid dehalogenase domain protein hydrolase [Caldicellulosiruptor hydrothermalis 108]
MNWIEYQNQEDIDYRRRFIEEFRFNFNEYKNKNIVLYGIGEKTKLILEEAKEFNFVGLMDKDTVGSVIYGLKVLSYDEVISSNVDLIIIVANMSVSELIYRRISFLKKDYGIEIKYINGTTPVDFGDEIISNDPYWLNDINKLKSEIEKHDVISFDVFDTLLMRKVLNPSDIFDLVERELYYKYNIEIPFKIKRIEAEKYCYNYIDKNYDIFQIYSVLKELLNITDNNLLNKIMQIEIELEMECCIPRSDIIDVYLYSIKKGKTVCITSDTYFNRKYLELLLRKNGILQFDKLLISCEEKKSKSGGDMFEYLKQLYKQKKILHIGDNQISDREIPQKYSISTFQVRSGYDLILSSLLKDLLINVKNSSDSILMGVSMFPLLKSPFSLNKGKGAIYINSMYDIGYSFFGPMVLNFVLWLIKMAKKERIEKLLFFSRDGYIIEKIYKKIVEFYDLDAPESIYFLTSRRASSVAAIENWEDVVFIIKNVCKCRNLKIKELINIAFGIYIEDKDEFAEKYYYEVTEKELLDYLYNYADLTFENAKKERANYLKYISSLTIKEARNIGCVNFVGKGVTQYCVSKIMKKDLCGYYFATEYDIKNIILPSQKAYGLYGELISPHLSKTSISTKYLFGEIVFTSPDGQLVKFDDNGQPVFEKNSINEFHFSIINECHEGMLAFVEEMIKLDRGLLERNFGNELIDKLYGLFTSHACFISDDIKKFFIVDDYYAPSRRGTNLFMD